MITGVDYKADLVLLANTPAQTESMLHSLEQVALVSTGIWIKQSYCVLNISLNGKPLKLVNQFTYLSSNISSTESDVNIGKAWMAIDKLSTI